MCLHEYSCNCPDFQGTHEPCIHIAALFLMRQMNLAKTLTNVHTSVNQDDVCVNQDDCYDTLGITALACPSSAEAEEEKHSNVVKKSIHRQLMKVSEIDIPTILVTVDALLLKVSSCDNLATLDKFNSVVSKFVQQFHTFKDTFSGVVAIVDTTNTDGHLGPELDSVHGNTHRLKQSTNAFIPSLIPKLVPNKTPGRSQESDDVDDKKNDLSAFKSATLANYDNKYRREPIADYLAQLLEDYQSDDDEDYAQSSTSSCEYTTDTDRGTDIDDTVCPAVVLSKDIAVKVVEVITEALQRSPEDVQWAKDMSIQKAEECAEDKARYAKLRWCITASKAHAILNYCLYGNSDVATLLSSITNPKFFQTSAMAFGNANEICVIKACNTTDFRQILCHIQAVNDGGLYFLKTCSIIAACPDILLDIAYETPDPNKLALKDAGGNVLQQYKGTLPGEIKSPESMETFIKTNLVTVKANQFSNALLVDTNSKVVQQVKYALKSTKNAINTQMQGWLSNSVFTVLLTTGLFRNSLIL